MELQNLSVLHLNDLHSLKGNILIENLKVQRCSAGFSQDTLRDALVGAAVTFFLLCVASPNYNRIVICGSVLSAVGSLVAHITTSAAATFQLAGKAGNVQGLACKIVQLLASCHFSLHKIEDLLVDDGFMGVLNIEPRFFLRFLVSESSIYSFVEEGYQCRLHC